MMAFITTANAGLLSASRSPMAMARDGLLPKALVVEVLALFAPGQQDSPLAACTDERLRTLANQLHSWSIKPAATEGYRTAEVTLGGIDTDELSSQTLESKRQPRLYFVGEVVDVTGHLGGYNFQWAWSSGHAAGQACAIITCRASASPTPEPPSRVVKNGTNTLFARASGTPGPLSAISMTTLFRRFNFAVSEITLNPFSLAT